MKVIFFGRHERLDTTILGLLQADSEGNVNSSKRGEGTINYVGPGGFIDLTTAAKNIIFVTKWMEHARVRQQVDQIRIIEPGKPKFVDRVDEITFCGKQALDAGLERPLRIIEIECEPHRKPSGKTGRGGPEQGDTILVATDLLDVPAEVVALIYKHRWAIEVFFRFFKHTYPPFLSF